MISSIGPTHNVMIQPANDTSSVPIFLLHFPEIHYQPLQPLQRGEVCEDSILEGKVETEVQNNEGKGERSEILMDKESLKGNNDSISKEEPQRKKMKSEAKHDFEKSVVEAEEEHDNVILIDDDEEDSSKGKTDSNTPKSPLVQYAEKLGTNRRTV